jgi:type I restriction enzyme S subunit
MAVEELVGPTPDGWEYTTLGMACQRGGGDIQTGPFGSQLHAADYVLFGIPSIMPQNIGDNRIIEDGIARITSADAKRLSRYLVRSGDIVYSRRGDVERRAFVRDHEDGWLCGTGCLRVRLGERGPDPRFTTYYLGHPSVREWIVRHAHGATMPNLNTSILSACPLMVPPLEEQRAIAHILGTLDAKIELNRLVDETLEEMARALFKSWFVDFDPVRAKSEGRDPGLPQPLADLFPDSFEDSELGEIPRGWDAMPLPEAIEVNPVRQMRKGDVAPYLDMANMPTRGHSPDEVVDRPFGSGMRFKNGDTLVARITPCLENGKTAYVDFLRDQQIGWGSTEYIVLRPKPPLPPEFAYCLARSNEFREFAIQSMTGSSGRQRVPAESLSHYLVVTPSKAIAAQFGQTVGPLFARAAGSARESRALAALRDALLPKLVSGELRTGARVPSADCMS